MLALYRAPRLKDLMRAPHAEVRLVLSAPLVGEIFSCLAPSPRAFWLLVTQGGTDKCATLEDFQVLSATNPRQDFACRLSLVDLTVQQLLKSACVSLPASQTPMLRIKAVVVAILITRLFSFMAD